jgi:hypothetical protein
MSSGSVLQWFTGRRLAIATMHGKEKVLAEPLEKALGVHCVLPEPFDTDRFGTFSGEVERPGDADFTLRLKCRAAMEATNCDLALASEGSFGPHPMLPFAAVGEERLFMTDRLHGLEIGVRSLSGSTNFQHAEITDWPALQAFAKSAGFPEHGLILSGVIEGEMKVFKGLAQTEHLESAFRALITGSDTIAVQTDMRAMHNPTRMLAIARLCDELLERILSICQGCSRPGFGERHYQRGLACAWCGTPTERLLSIETRCSHCGHAEIQLYPDGVEAADPGNCPHCNP